MTARTERGRGTVRNGRPAHAPEERRESVADETRRYIESRPSIRDCLRYDVVNFTALARRIRAETGLPSQEAIEIACRRYRRQQPDDPTQDELLRSVLRSSHIEIRTHVAVITVRGDFAFPERTVVGTGEPGAKRDRLVQLFQGSGAATLLCGEETLASVLATIPRTSVLNVQHRLSLVSIRSPEEVMATPRVLGFLAEAIGRAGINCVEIVSVYTDTFFVVRVPDAVRVFEILSDLARAVDAPGLETEALRAAPPTGPVLGPVGEPTPFPPRRPTHR
ncbi:MAG: hypothetical protein ACLPZM_01325 [Thermoplasmata archaeon]